MRFIIDASFLQGGFIRRPAGIDAVVDTGVMNQQRSFDFRRIFCSRLRAVERYTRRQIGKFGRQVVDDAAALAKADCADFAVTLR
jgi:hypothetical protein